MNIILDKTTCAKDQLLSAIDIYFNSPDKVVSIHTLICSANEILDRLLLKTANEGGVVREGLKLIKESERSFVLKKINSYKNFFKHANKDHDKTIDFNPGLSKYMIWDTIKLYEKLGNVISNEMFVFSVLFRVEESHLWTEPSSIDHMIEGALENISSVDKSVIYKEMLSQSEKLRE
jgi:hypothetical protein